ncbi:uncharacterized protein PADG_07885 [Paracoccidioides brasiliensis Pb18]|uniref:Alcohol dehydrogenase iron-type/glycerol dehydrogenase GldA domain-containing protein n=1 Tax=Paracoccidioides brasiliensis (strain Pb18) TaxID=502780 RepID=C1GL99_PARBD|nr:uncharacterized protein PADG_07885 [Paracoccidioides brasiliensis Pb18]EEH43065.2 hypothetical protein PADG_07885 [Paracoccidioides brasiliensis Pb18]
MASSSSSPIIQGHSIDSSLRGAYSASPIKYMLYGRGCITSLPDVVAKLGASKAYIITGRSLREKTPVIKQIEEILGVEHHVGTYSGVRQHAPLADIESAISAVRESGADVLVSVGGGSPIDAAKAIAYHLHVNNDDANGGRKWIPSIAVPTTLSVAETTKNAGFTNAEGAKVSVSDAELVPKGSFLPTSIGCISLCGRMGFVKLAFEETIYLTPMRCIAVLYDGDLALHTPLRLWLSSAACFPPPPPPSTREGEEAKQIARAVAFIPGLKGTGRVGGDALLVAEAVEGLVGRLGLASGLADYNVKSGEEEDIAIRALRDPTHPDLKAVTELVRTMYTSSTSSEVTMRL